MGRTHHMTDAPLRAAIIGTGRIGSALERDPLRTKPHTHAGWYVSHPHILLSGGADTNADRLQAFGVDWNIPADRLFAAYPELLRVVAPDLVSICAYAPDRVAMARAALAAGARGLWLEKAVATSVASARALRAAAAAAGASVVVNHPRSQDPQYRAVRRLIADGTLGPLESIHVRLQRAPDPHGHARLGGPRELVRPMGRGPYLARRDARRCVRRRRRGRVRTAARRLPGPASDIGGRVHIRFANGVDAFVSGGRKSYFIFQFDLIFAKGRVLLGNDANQVFVTGPSPRYSGFVELTEAAWRLEGPGGAPLVTVLADAVRQGAADLSSLDAAIGALALGIATVQAGATPGVAVTPGTLDPALVVDSV